MTTETLDKKLEVGKKYNINSAELICVRNNEGMTGFAKATEVKGITYIKEDIYITSELDINEKDISGKLLRREFYYSNHPADREHFERLLKLIGDKKC